MVLKELLNDPTFTVTAVQSNKGNLDLIKARRQIVCVVDLHQNRWPFGLQERLVHLPPGAQRNDSFQRVSP